MRFFGIEGTVRVSFAIYNTFEEIDSLLEVISKLLKPRN
jgi:cysteine desulfurase/selenocysteine lyase